MRETVYPGCLHVGEWLNGVWRKPKLRNAKPTKESMWCWNCSRDRKQSKEGKPLYTPGRLARSSKCTKSTLHHLNLQGHKIDKQKKRKKKKEQQQQALSKQVGHHTGPHPDAYILASGDPQSHMQPWPLITLVQHWFDRVPHLVIWKLQWHHPAPHCLTLWSFSFHAAQFG